MLVAARDEKRDGGKVELEMWACGESTTTPSCDSPDAGLGRLDGRSRQQTWQRSLKPSRRCITAIH